MTTSTREQTHQQNGHSTTHQQDMAARAYILALKKHEKPDMPDVGKWKQLCDTLEASYNDDPNTIEQVIGSLIKSKKYPDLKDLLDGKEPEQPSIFTLQDLMKKQLPPVKWVIPDMLPEGLFLLTGKPKLGKSWLCFDIALAIAYGGYVMGKIQVPKGEVLYLALEDNERRIQSRMSKLLSNAEGQAPDGLYMDLTWPRIDKGGAEHLDEWIKEHPKVRIIIIDTWAKLSPRITSKQQSLYETQYDALVPLKAISDKYAISIIAVHHNRKMGADDVVDEISGSTGLTGSVDGFWILKRERGQTDAVLHIIGRDIEEEQALAINFDAREARWKLEGNAEDFAKTKERQEILDLLKANPDGLKAKEIATALGKNIFTLRNLLVKLRDEKKIELTKDSYTLYRSERSERSDDSYQETL